jgi:hypothetical protein
LKTARYSRHNGEVFLAWNMMETQCIPEDDVSVLYSSVPAMPTIIFLQKHKTIASFEAILLVIFPSAS